MPPQSHRRAALIMLERSGSRAMALRRFVREHTVLETRSWESCLREVMDRPGSVVCIKVTRSNFSSVARCVRHIRANCSQPLIMAALDRTVDVAAEVLHECGCFYVWTSVFQLRNVGKIANRHLSAQSLPHATLVEQLWQRLPWKSAT